jgi:nucleotide-binding universal stress UspA family protein
VARLAAARFHAGEKRREADAASEILACAADWHPDVIVMGSHARSGLGRLLSASVSDHVARHAPGPVEAVREPTTAVHGRYRDATRSTHGGTSSHSSEDVA